MSESDEAVCWRGMMGICGFVTGGLGTTKKSSDSLLNTETDAMRSGACAVLF